MSPLSHPILRVVAPEADVATGLVPYSPPHAAEWNAFVDQSKNGTFLHRRDFIEYHAHRFEDASLMAYDEDKLVAVLPLSRVGDRATSHGGLTFGGVICSASMRTARMLRLFQDLRVHLRSIGIRKLHYKTIPSIYHQMPAEEDVYALFRAGAQIVRRDLLTVIDLSNRPKLSGGRRDGIRKAQRGRVLIRESKDFASFWKILESRLRDRHDAAPVHSIAEIQTLAKRFPNAIRLHAGFDGTTMLGGCVVFSSARVAHVQYIASTTEGRALGALDLLFEELIGRTYADLRYFDFGTSSRKDGQFLNQGLVFQKEGFGGRGVVHDFYEWDLYG